MLRDRIVAHRGYQKRYPENSLLGFQKAIEAGARYIETDVLFSSDHQPVLYHDITMSRISGVESMLHCHSLEQLLQVKAHEPNRLGEQFIRNTITPLSALVELLTQHPEITSFIEIKRGGLEIIGFEKAFEVVSKVLKPVQSQCVIISFNDDFIHYASEQHYPRLGVVLKNWDDLYSSASKALRPEYIFCDIKKIPQEAILDSIESTTVIYEVEEPEEAISWFKRGADMVETFDIGGMIKVLAHKAM